VRASANVQSRSPTPSATLAAQLLKAFDLDFQPSNAWHIGCVVGTHEVAWISEQPGRTDVEPHDPASAWRRGLRSLAKLLPGLRPYL
jgi:hypothetical protein